MIWKMLLSSWIIYTKKDKPNSKNLSQVTADLKDNQKRNEALGFLIDVAGDNLNDKRFMQFL